MSATVSAVPPSKPTGPRALVAAPVFGTARRDLAAAGVLSAVAGYVDAAGFIGLFGLFAAHVTGDIVAAGTTLGAGLHQGLTLRLAALLVFMISVATAALIARAARRRRRRPVTALFALMTVALALFCTTGVVLQPQLQGPNGWAVLATAAVGVFGMGIQNALMRDALCSLGATTLMTGNLTQLTIDLVEVLFPDEPSGPSSSNGPPSERTVRRVDTRRRMTKSAIAVSAFLIGTVAGGLGITLCGFWSLALPALAMGSLTASTWLQSRVCEPQAAAQGSPVLATARVASPKRISGIQPVEARTRTWMIRGRPKIKPIAVEK